MKVGEKEIDVKQFRNDWALALMTQGIIVRLTIGRWKGTATLKEEELGLKCHREDGRTFMDRYITLGSEKLLPPAFDKDLRKIERDARSTLLSYSFPTVWGPFVPFTAFEEWEQQNNIFRGKFLAQASVLSDQYYNIIATVKTEYKKMAYEVWRRLHPNGTDEPPDSFTENFVNKIVDKIPSQSKIISSFKYNVTYFVIPMPSIIEENVSKARGEERKREMGDFKAELERETKRKVADEYLKRKQELIDGFLDSTIVSIRKHVAELCDGVLQSLSRQNVKREITRVQKNRIKKTIDKVKLLNFYDDKEMTALMMNLESEISKFKGERDHAEIVSTLQKIVSIGTEDFAPTDFNPAISTLEV